MDKTTKVSGFLVIVLFCSTGATLYCQRKNDIVLEHEKLSKTYFVVNSRLNWTEAERLCLTNYSGTLLSIENEEEQNFVSRVLSREPFVSLVNNQFVWTGLIPINGEWRWSENKSLIERNRTFLPGFLDLKTASNQRVVFGIGETTWATTEIENKYPFICESEIKLSAEERENEIVFGDATNTKAYYLVNNSMNWMAAYKYCLKSYNGSLLAIDNAEEQMFISRALSTNRFVSYINNQSVWTGLNGIGGQLKWSTYSSFEGDNSHYLEPNFVNKTLSRSEMVSMQPGDHKWEIMFGITKLPFVCESATALQFLCGLHFTTIDFTSPKTIKPTSATFISNQMNSSTRDSSTTSPHMNSLIRSSLKSNQQTLSTSATVSTSPHTTSSPSASSTISPQMNSLQTVSGSVGFILTLAINDSYTTNIQMTSSKTSQVTSSLQLTPSLNAKNLTSPQMTGPQNSSSTSVPLSIFPQMTLSNVSVTSSPQMNSNAPPTNIRQTISSTNDPRTTALRMTSSPSSPVTSPQTSSSTSIPLTSPPQMTSSSSILVRTSQQTRSFTGNPRTISPQITSSSGVLRTTSPQTSFSTSVQLKTSPEMTSSKNAQDTISPQMSSSTSAPLTTPLQMTSSSSYPVRASPQTSSFTSVHLTTSPQRTSPSGVLRTTSSQTSSSTSVQLTTSPLTSSKNAQDTTSPQTSSSTIAQLTTALRMTLSPSYPVRASPQTSSSTSAPLTTPPQKTSSSSTPVRTSQQTSSSTSAQLTTSPQRTSPSGVIRTTSPQTSSSTSVQLTTSPLTSSKSAPDTTSSQSTSAPLKTFPQMTSSPSSPVTKSPHTNSSSSTAYTISTGDPTVTTSLQMTLSQPAIVTTSIQKTIPNAPRTTSLLTSETTNHRTISSVTTLKQQTKTFKVSVTAILKTIEPNSVNVSNRPNASSVATAQPTVSPAITSVITSLQAHPSTSAPVVISKKPATLFHSFGLSLATQTASITVPHKSSSMSVFATTNSTRPSSTQSQALIITTNSYIQKSNSIRYTKYAAIASGCMLLAAVVLVILTILWKNRKFRRKSVKWNHPHITLRIPRPHVSKQNDYVSMATIKRSQHLVGASNVFMINVHDPNADSEFHINFHRNAQDKTDCDVEPERDYDYIDFEYDY